MPEFVEKWGKNTARSRYGTTPEFSPSPDQSAPQCPEDKQGPGYKNDTPSGWVTGAGENATGKPGFDRGRK
jgi:hypothetical protein